MKSTNMLERLNEEIPRRTYVANLPQRRELPQAGAGAAVERREAWLEDHRYLNMDLLKQHKKETLRRLPPVRAVLSS